MQTPRKCKQFVSAERERDRERARKKGCMIYAHLALQQERRGKEDHDTIKKMLFDMTRRGF